MIKLTQSKLKMLLKYNSRKGEFTWLVDNKSTSYGAVAGHKTKKGHITIKIDGKTYLRGRLVWLWMTGEFPEYPLSHINGNNEDDRYSNLTKIIKPNPNLYKGVTKKGNKYQSQVTGNKNERPIYLGLYDTAKEAGEAYIDFQLRRLGV